MGNILLQKLIESVVDNELAVDEIQFIWSIMPNKDLVVKAMLGEELAGFLKLEPRVYDRKVMAVFDVRVAPEFRRQGIGLKMYAFAHDVCKSELGLPMASDTQRNINADNLWQKLRARLVEFEDQDTEEQLDYYVLR